MSNATRLAEKRANESKKMVEDFVKKDGAVIFNHQRLMEYRLSTIQEILLEFNPARLMLFILAPKSVKMKWADKIIAKICKADEKEQAECLHDQRVAEMEAEKKERAEKSKGHYKGFRAGHCPGLKSVVEIKSKDGQAVTVAPETNKVRDGSIKLEELN